MLVFGGIEVKVLEGKAERTWLERFEEKAKW